MKDADGLPARLRLARSVRVRIGPERGFLFDERTGRVYSLNATAAFAAARLKDGEPVARTIEALVAEFDVDAGTAGRDLARFVAQLGEEGLADAGGDADG